MYGCEIWTVKKAERRRIDAFELWCWRRLLRVPWTARTSNQSILKEGLDAEAETLILWPPDVKSWLIGKDSDAGRDWGQEEKGMTENEMVGWLHWLDGHELEQSPGAGDGQGSLECYSPWCHNQTWLSNCTEQLSNSNFVIYQCIEKLKWFLMYVIRDM